eukprot:768126-Amphidinium_carterae.1
MLVDVVAVELVMLGDDVPELVRADVVEDVDVFEGMLDDVGVLIEVDDVNVNLVLAVLGGVVQFIRVHVSTLTLALLVLVEVWEVDLNLVVELVVLDVELIVLDVEVVDDLLGFGDKLVDVDVGELVVLGGNVLELVNVDVVEDVEVLVEVFDVLTCEGVLVDVDAVEQGVLGSDVSELVDADVVKKGDLLEKLLGGVGVVVLDVDAEDDLLVHEGVIVDADVHNPVVLRGDALELVDAV